MNASPTQPVELEVIGWPIGHSLSPVMHGAALAELALRDPAFARWRYGAVAVPPDALAAYVTAARARPSLRGFNVTVPHKVAIAALLDGLEPSAIAVGAVNTVCREGEALVGSNTDVEGFARSAEEAGISLACNTLVLGAGGAARAVICALASRGARSIAVAARRIEAAEALAPLAGPIPFAAHALDFDALGSLSPDVVIQASSASLDPGQGHALAACIPWSSWPDARFIELVYRPARGLGREGTPPTRCMDTALTREARARHRVVLGGDGMLVHQGALALERWTGLAVDRGSMHRALEEALASE